MGVIYDAQGSVLVNRRTQPPQFAGKWEFPGGKMEPGETIDQSLHRELYEELGIKTVSSELLISITHDYPHATVRLTVHKVTDYTGNPIGNEGQEIRWVDPASLEALDFLPANEPILSAVRLASI